MEMSFRPQSAILFSPLIQNEGDQWETGSLAPVWSYENQSLLVVDEDRGHDEGNDSLIKSRDTERDDERTPAVNVIKLTPNKSRQDHVQYY